MDRDPGRNSRLDDDDEYQVAAVRNGAGQS